MIVGERKLGVRGGTITGEYVCSAELNLASKHQLRIVPQGLNNTEVFRSVITDEAFWLEGDGLEPVQCLLDSDGLTPLRTPLIFSTRNDLVSMECGVVNFSVGRVPYKCVNFTFEEWRIDLTPTSSRTVEFHPDIQNDQWRVTHHLHVTKSGKSFTCLEAQELLHRFSQFMSFCQGTRATFVFVTGRGVTGEMVYQEWGVGSVDKLTGAAAWASPHHLAEASQFFSGFMLQLKDQRFAAAMQYILYWNVRGDTNYAGPDGSFILLQAALERLAHHVLVERQALTGFDKLSAGAKLRSLLQALSLPTDVPLDLPALADLASFLGNVDGPGTITKIRNELVHPKQRIARKLPFYEAYVLAKWYLELCILKLCGYKGPYSNRLRRRWAGEVENVP